MLCYAVVQYYISLFIKSICPPVLLVGGGERNRLGFPLVLRVNFLQLL